MKATHYHANEQSSSLWSRFRIKTKGNNNENGKDKEHKH